MKKSLFAGEGAAVVGDAADIGDCGVAHGLELLHGLTAAAAAEAVDEQGSGQIGNQVRDPGKILQGEVDAVGDAAVRIFLGGTHVKKNRSGGILEGDDTGVDVGGFEHVQQTHGENLLCGGM